MKDKTYWRLSISLPKEMEVEIIKLRQDERFVRMSYAEIMRMLLEAGLKAERAGKSA